MYTPTPADEYAPAPPVFGPSHEALDELARLKGAVAEARGHLGVLDRIRGILDDEGMLDTSEELVDALLEESVAIRILADEFSDRIGQLESDLSEAKWSLEHSLHRF